MAFNFNWSPLIADTDRVREMLTSSLNKSPKPPIIVDDIIVNELNLGSTPPQLEILEIGDLAEDRFRGIFKMSYTGDAYLTLKTRVQANPLNTYLSTKPSFASPRPLAAASGLTIPLQITLSDIRLSGFVILVFSKQKGITLVFRNDPLESLKVSSTFDSIPFVRDYLQRTIESQLRILFVEDLPAIIHRLSLKMFNPDYQTAELQEPSKSLNTDQRPIDPLSSPFQSSVDGASHSIADGDAFSLDTPTEMYATFSQKNLLRLAALAESQRTLSLFTPGIRDTVYRAWASAADRHAVSHGTSTPLPRPATLSRLQSVNSSYSGWSSPASQASDTPSFGTRPSIASMNSMGSTYSFGSGRPRAQRKRKHRIVDLRRHRPDSQTSDDVSVSSGYPDSASQTASVSAGQSIAVTEPSSLPSSLAREGEITTPPRSPQKKVDFRRSSDEPRPRQHALRHSETVTPEEEELETPDYDADATPRASTILPRTGTGTVKPRRQPPRMLSPPGRSEPMHIPRSLSELSLHTLSLALQEGPTTHTSSGGILEQAWVAKMANEIARKVADETAKQTSWHDGMGMNSPTAVDAPPAYAS